MSSIVAIKTKSNSKSIEQSQQLKPYIDFNTEKRKTIFNNFEKDLSKLVNSVYGKRLEKLRNKVDVRLVINSKDQKELVSKPIFFFQKILSKNLIAVHKVIKVLTRNSQHILVCVYSTRFNFY